MILPSRQGSGFSSEAKTLGEEVAKIAERLSESQALFGKQAAAISELRSLADDCAVEDWDGYGARAIGLQAILLAEDFVHALPEGVPPPEFAPEPDGSVSMDWIRSRNRLFSVSVGDSNRLAFAWLDGTDKGHAVAYFDGRTIPQRILEGINAIVNHGNASVWVA